MLRHSATVTLGAWTEMPDVVLWSSKVLSCPCPPGWGRGRDPPALPSVLQSFKQSLAPNSPRCFAASETNPCSCASPGSGEAGEQKVWIFFLCADLCPFCFLQSEQRVHHPSEPPARCIYPSHRSRRKWRRCCLASPPPREGAEFPSSAARAAPALDARCAHTR